MTDFVALRSLMFAGECFFGASLILALAWLVARNGTASRRHLIWLGAFVAMLLLPILTQILPPGIIVHMPPEPAPVMTPMVTGAAVATPAAPSIGLVEVVTGLLFVWLAGVAVIAARMFAGLFGLFLLYRRSVPHIPDGIDGAKFRDVRWQLRLRTAPGNEGPVTWGIFKSTVLLPKASVRWSRERLEAVLLHEVAHVRRRDSLARLIALIACAFYWPNPFVWTAATRMRREAEIAADDVVLTSGVRASAYAEQLVGLAREFSHERVSFAGVTLSMAERSTLKERVQSVLTPSQPRSGVTKTDVLKVAALGVAVTAVLALARPCLAEAQDTKTVVPAAHSTKTVMVRVVSKDDESSMDEVSKDESDEPSKETTEIAVVDEAPPAPEAPPSAPAPISPPAPPSPVIAPPAPPVTAHVHMTSEERAAFHRAMEAQRAELRRAEAEMRRAHAEIRKAITDAHVRESVAQAMAQSRAAIQQTKVVNQAEIRRVIAEAKVAETVANAMERARPAIEHAAELASERAAAAAERAQERAERVKERAEQAKERAEEAAERARQRAEDREHD